MAKGYWMIHASVSDPAAFEAYKALSTVAADAYGGRYLTRGGASEIVEGGSRDRHVIIEYPTYAAALEAYRSPQYAAARAARENAAVFDVVVVEGLPD